MEKIFLTKEEKDILIRLKKADRYMLSHSDFKYSIEIFRVLRSKGFIVFVLDSGNNYNANTYKLSNKGIDYMSQYPNLDSPSTEEEIEENKRIERNRITRKDIIYWIITILAVLLGYLLGKFA